MRTHQLVVLDEQWWVDPWMNICCLTKDFPAQAAAKLKKWTAHGKRIAVTRGDISYWTAPSQPEIDGIFGPAAEWYETAWDEALP